MKEDEDVCRGSVSTVPGDYKRKLEKRGKNALAALTTLLVIH